MSRIVYVNGAYLPEEEAKISVFDRGFIFGDGIYEVSAVIGGKLVDCEAHLARLERSCGEIRLALPWSKAELVAVHEELIKRNNLDEGGIYLQVSRGASDRDFPFPKDVAPTLVMFTQARNFVNAPAAKTGIKVVSTPDLRWARRDIKTVQLLYPSMAKMMARQAGADDGWFVQDGFVTEGTANNAYIVKDGQIITRALSNDILHGITRAALLLYAREAQIKVVERNFTVDEAKAADEAFITGASTFVTPVVEIDGGKIGGGAPGPVARRLRELYIQEARKGAV